MHKGEISPGKYLSGMFLTVEKKLTKTAAPILLMFDIFHLLASQGFKAIYGRASSLRGLTLSLRDGAKILSEDKINLNGK